MNKSLYNKEYHIRNIERLTIYCKKRYQKNREKNILYAKEYRKNHLDYSKKYHQKNREKEKQYRKQYYIKNRDKILNRCKKYNQIPEIKKLHEIRYGAEYQREYRNKNKEKLNLQRLEIRHERGINKRYNNLLGIFQTKEYKRLSRKRYKALFKGGGPLTIQTIQEVYEDNIKKYGTLTCYLCLKPILFGDDHLEHKTPLTRGGTNAKENLAPACPHCNNSKYNKTEKEYRDWLINKKIKKEVCKNENQ